MVRVMRLFWKSESQSCHSCHFFTLVGPCRSTFFSISISILSLFLPSRVHRACDTHMPHGMSGYVLVRNFVSFLDLDIVSLLYIGVGKWYVNHACM